MCIRDRNERLLSILSTKENVNLATLGFAEENVKKYQAIITPIDIAGERLGTLFIYKCDEQYDIDDIILSEYGTCLLYTYLKPRFTLAHNSGLMR